MLNYYPNSNIPCFSVFLTGSFIWCYSRTKIWHFNINRIWYFHILFIQPGFTQMTNLHFWKLWSIFITLWHSKVLMLYLLLAIWTLFCLEGCAVCLCWVREGSNDEDPWTLCIYSFFSQIGFIWLVPLWLAKLATKETYWWIQDYNVVLFMVLEETYDWLCSWYNILSNILNCL